MSALRLARAATGRDVLIKFDGCYHGHADSFLVRAGSGVATLGLPNSPGVPDVLAALTLTVPFNDVYGAEQTLRAHGDRVAAIIVEPVVGNSGFIAPDPEFLPALRRLATEHGKRFLELSAYRLGLSPPEEIDDHKAYYSKRELWSLLRRGGFKPREISVHTHKFGLNTFAVCEVGS